ncbi:carbohydrate ABC transporter permease [Oricola sp.]|uniref:carbohydrate ABC transporter permease n=1 Tax=Oricola sp. TaxID=1979950 RepID=UPI003BAAE5E8
MLAPLIFGLVVFAVYPFVFLVFLSFSDSTLANQFNGWLGWDNFVWSFEGTDFPETLQRTIIFALSASVIQMCAGFMIAWLLFTAFQDQKFVRALILLPLMTPPVAVGVTWKLLFNTNGWFNTALMSLGLVSEPISFLGEGHYAFPAIMAADTWQWTPFIVILCYAALVSLPKSVFEAAAIDGAYRRQMLLHVIVPMLWPQLLAVFLIRLIIAFKTFDLVYVLTFGGPGNATNISSFEIWKTAMREFDLGLAAAQTLILAVVVTVVTLPVVLWHKHVDARR